MHLPWILTLIVVTASGGKWLWQTSAEVADLKRGLTTATARIEAVYVDGTKALQDHLISEAGNDVILQQVRMTGQETSAEVKALRAQNNTILQTLVRLETKMEKNEPDQ